MVPLGLPELGPQVVLISGSLHKKLYRKLLIAVKLTFRGDSLVVTPLKLDLSSLSLDWPKFSLLSSDSFSSSDFDLGWISIILESKVLISHLLNLKYKKTK